MKWEKVWCIFSDRPPSEEECNYGQAIITNLLRIRRGIAKGGRERRKVTKKEKKERRKERKKEKRKERKQDSKKEKKQKERKKAR